MTDTPNNTNEQLPHIYTKPTTYPHENLTDREFEELLYLIFKKRIKDGNYTEIFDDVTLMPGVGEQGRDCRLSYQGSPTGLVQCKHSINPTSRLSKPDAALEIIKFALYYLQDDSLMADPHNFTYFLAVSGDFSGPAIKLLDTFNRQITKEADFPKWVNRVIADHQTLTMTFDTVKDVLSDVLQAITVRKITRTDLDLDLANASEIVKHMFPILSVVSVDDARTMLREETGEQTQHIIEAVRTIKDEYPTPIVASDAINQALSSEFREQIEYAKELLAQFKPDQALQFLESIKKRMWDKAESEAKYHWLAYVGFAYLQKSQDLEAAQMFIDAYRLNPNRPQAIANAALGYLLQNNLEQSYILAQQALREDPTLERAYSLLVRAAPPDKSFASALASVPSVYQNKPEISMALGDLAREHNLLPEATHWFRVAMQADPNHPEPRAKLATALFENLEDKHLHPLPGMANPDVETLTEIVSLYAWAWERIAQTEMMPHRIGWLINLAITKTLLGDVQGAEQDFDLALRIQPDDTGIMRDRALLAHRKGDSAKAASLFRRILDSDSPSDAQFWLAVILLEDGRLPEAESLIQEFIASAPSPVLLIEAQSLLVIIKIHRDHPLEAREIVDSLREEHPGNVDILRLDAEVSIREGKRNDATAKLITAQSMLTPETDPVTRYRLASALLDNEVFDRASAILESLVNTEVNVRPVHQLAYCYYRSGRLGDALAICQTLREKYGLHQLLTVMETAIHEEIDDLSSAQRICEQYLEVYPDNLQVLLRLMTVYYRLKAFDALDALLEKNIALPRLTLDGHLIFAQLLFFRGKTRQALHVMYEARRQFFDKQEAHDFYATNFFFRVGQDKNRDKWFQNNEVGIDTAVCVTNEEGEQPRWIIIDDRGDVDMQRGELSPDNTLALKLLGSKVGDCVEISQSLFAENVLIKEVKSKFIYALHETLELYPTHFTDDPHMWRFSIQYAKDGTISAKETFQPLFEITNNQQNHVARAKELYRAGWLPIGSLANLLNTNPIAVLGQLTQDPRPGIRCSSGQTTELEEAITVAQPGSRFIMDITSLITLHQLDIADEVAAVYGKFGIVRKTLELIEHFLEQWIGLPDFTFWGKDSDQRIKRSTETFVTAEVAAYNSQFLEDILAWAKENCEILPCEAALNTRRDTREQLGEAIGASFVETVLVAHDKQMVLYSEDVKLREFLKYAHGVPGVWTQAMLKRLRADKRISDKLYAQAVIKLVCLHYHHVSIESLVLLEAAQIAQWKPTYPFDRVVGRLGGNHSNAQSALVVACQWAYDLWIQKRLPEEYEGLILQTLDAIASDRNRGERVGIINSFETEMAGRFKMAPLTVLQIRNFVELWKRLHIL